jgi:hypothetical protein
MMTRYAMPVIKIEALEGEAADYARRITVADGGGARILRSSKPTAKGQGRAAYVWRMVAFSVSSNPRHQCMPCTADWDLADDYRGADRRVDHDALRAECGRLDKIVDQIVAVVPKEQWAGVIRWGNALGVIGRPQVAADGSIIYR